MSLHVLFFLEISCFSYKFNRHFLLHAPFLQLTYLLSVFTFFLNSEAKIVSTKDIASLKYHGIFSHL